MGSQINVCYDGKTELKSGIRDRAVKKEILINKK